MLLRVWHLINVFLDATKKLFFLVFYLGFYIIILYQVYFWMPQKNNFIIWKCWFCILFHFFILIVYNLESTLSLTNYIHFSQSPPQNDIPRSFRENLNVFFFFSKKNSMLIYDWKLSVNVFIDILENLYEVSHIPSTSFNHIGILQAQKQSKFHKKIQSPFLFI